jgi:uncharacterized protein YcbK (DUF882 family)
VVFTMNTPASISRRSVLIGALGCIAGAAAGPALASPAILAGKGDIRLVSLVNPRTGDKLTSVYWVDGVYIPEVLAEIDHLMRDWRADQKRKIAPAVIDIMSASHKLLGASEPFTVFSGYRSARTNAMLRRESRGVARNSYHVKGMAADLHMKSRSVSQIARAAASLNCGGVGRYSRSDFVHMDCGPVRSWGR